MTSNTYDSEFLEVFELRPRRFAVSMLRSQKEEVMKVQRDREQASMASVESAAVAVNSARLEFLEAGLLADWGKAQTLKGSVALVADEQHLWRQKWLSQQEGNASKSIDWYMDQCMRMTQVSTFSMWKASSTDFIKYIAQKLNVNRANILIVQARPSDISVIWGTSLHGQTHGEKELQMLGIHATHINATCMTHATLIPQNFDLNAPFARSKQRIKLVANAVSNMNSDNKQKSIALVHLSDVATQGAVKGVQDDDDVLCNEMNSQAQDVDTRIAVWSEREGNVFNALPSCHFGRLVVDKATKSDNLFLTKSKLGTKRRPERVAKLPPFSALLQAESLSADADVLNRERQTTSVERLAAQKGTDFFVATVQSLLDGVNPTTKNPVLIMDFCPGLGCNALGARRLQTENPTWNVHYFSAETDMKDYEFARARVRGELGKEWLEGSLAHPSLKPERVCPPLPQSIISSIPGAESAMGDLASVVWKVCRIESGKLKIHEQHVTWFRATY